MPGLKSALPDLEIFRARDAVLLSDTDMMVYDAESFARSAKERQALADAGSKAGGKVNVLFSRPGGMSLAHVWFKSGYPLPSHSHSSACLYYVVAGSLSMGSQVLGPGDGFYIEPDTAYTYIPGPDGVELLEFRDTDSFDIKMVDRKPQWWADALERTNRCKDNWPQEGMPSGNAPFGRP